MAMLFLVSLLRRPSGARVQIVRAVRADLVAPILCDGTLEPPAGGELRATEAAAVAEIFRREGERVKKATPLVRLDNPVLTEKAHEARSEVSQLLPERTKALADLDEGKREASRREKLFDADGRLLREGAITRESYETDELALRQANERVRLAQARLRSLDGATSEEGQTASRLALAEASARDLERRVANLLVRAPADGIVYGLPRKTGETVAAGEVVANVADPEHLRVRARVDQPDLPRIAVGQRFLATFDGLSGRRWEGTVKLVSPGLREVAGRQVGEVMGEISDPSSTLPFNASVNVQIVVGEKKSALVIARAALYRDGERRYVYLFRDGRAHRQEVFVGLIGLNQVEITRGLAEGDWTILPGTAPLSEGLRVVVAKES